ncbi:uncharacterized protein LOC126833816 [Adelges cooleyi]|uniref:uncharacterized protein LOC126833816 n=1 Tax=Adelges cooleyi TaxID=133065 RepID=UPI0021807892|nr:uncharacterized protein LOC126833816 [Adelges cooleyi]
MQYKFLFFICVYIIYISTIIHAADKQYFPNLPVGEYKLKFKAAYVCNASADYKIGFYLHLTKVSPTKTMLVGNITGRIVFDDSLTLHVNMAVMDKIGGWKDNAYIFSKDKACSTLKYFLGKQWPVLMDSLNMNDHNCPIKIRTDPMKGFDLTLIEDSNFPKQFFYGTYKFKLSYVDVKNQLVGCVVFVVEIIRPWEVQYRFQ